MFELPITDDVNSKFVQGFCDAEGSVNVRKLTIEIKQKNTKDGSSRIMFINKKLNSLGIKNSINGPNCENRLIIRLSGGKKNLENLKRFRELIGFSNPEKQEKLNLTVLSTGHMA